MLGADDYNSHCDPDKTKKALLNKFKTGLSKIVDKKVEELVKYFGGKDAKSCVDFSNEQEPDPRTLITWPVSPNLDIYVERPPQPLGPILYDNCYA